MVTLMPQYHCFYTTYCGLKHLQDLQRTLRISVAETSIRTTYLLLLSTVARLKLKCARPTVLHARTIEKDFYVIKMHLKLSPILRDSTTFAGFSQISK